MACRKVKDKQELVRLVLVTDGSIEIDTGGTKQGRGAYLCRSQGCWETGLKGNQLGNVLRTTLAQDDREKLLKHGKDLFQGVN